MLLQQAVESVGTTPFPVSAELREYLRIVVDLLKAVAWPLIVGAVLFRFKDIIAQAIVRSREIALKVAGAEITITAADAADALSDLFQEFDTILSRHLTPAEKQLFLRINSYGHVPRVSEVLPEFRRGDTDLHKMLRALRGVYFIRPVEGGTWQSDKHIEITNLGRLVLEHKSEALIAGVVTAPTTPQ